MSGAAALAPARQFIDALDRNDVDALYEVVDPSGWWWVDTGLDRASGDPSIDPGRDRPWPLHGRMGLGEKLELLRGIATRFPGGVRQRAWSWFADDERAVIEVEGDGTTNSGRRYTNRYAFVLDVTDGKVHGVREYLDTAHSADVFDGRNLDRRSSADRPTEPADVWPDRLSANLARQFITGIAEASPERVLSVCTSNATWWADSGADREPGRFDAPVQEGDRVGLFGVARLSARVRHLPGLVSTFTGGWELVPQRVVASDDRVAVEAASHGVRADGAVYQNRYCMVFELRNGAIDTVREYCDTLHAIDTFLRRRD